MMKRLTAAAAAVAAAGSILAGSVMPVLAAEDQTYQYTVDLTGGKTITLKAYQLHGAGVNYHGFQHNPALDTSVEKDAEAFVQTYFFDRSNGQVIGGDNAAWDDDHNVVYAVVPNGTQKVVYLSVNQTQYSGDDKAYAALVDITLESGDQNGVFDTATATQMFDTASKDFYYVNRLFLIGLGSGQDAAAGQAQQ